MSSFIIGPCIGIGGLLVLSLSLYVFSFTPISRKKEITEVCRIVSLAVLASAVVAFGVCAAMLHRCPNCNYLTDDKFCTECGCEIQPIIICSVCKNEFGAEHAPAFCPDCGTKVKGQ